MAGQGDRGGTFRILGARNAEERGRGHDKGVGNRPRHEGAGGRDGQNVSAKGEVAPGGLPRKVQGSKDKIWI